MLELPLDPLAVPAAEAARLCGVSRATWWRIHSGGKCPLPVLVTEKSPRWRLNELRAWMDACCPNRQAWKAMREEKR